VRDLDSEIFTDSGLLDTDPTSPLTFGKLQQIIAKQRLLNQQQLLQQINRGPAIQCK
jgi:hypothetical protein